MIASFSTWYQWFDAARENEFFVGDVLTLSTLGVLDPETLTIYKGATSKLMRFDHI